ncbi:uncharacterized protein LOC119589644 [Penaeus monodon]|uniref:uncharacterized protein LOC119589644 n=1 Tax=Penaeus monodon TaxID=6687 RepID=UPI0018A7968B|nr:uncharacterized protein LOC119589644 [Penaeus monodon]
MCQNLPRVPLVNAHNFVRMVEKERGWRLSGSFASVQVLVMLRGLFKLFVKVSTFCRFYERMMLGKSIQEDQLEIFRQIEDNISSLGVDGRACVLRFICEMQTNKFSRASLFGELFTLLFTPKPGAPYTVLKGEISPPGKKGSPGGKGTGLLSPKTRDCPLSVFAALRRLRGDVVAEMPTNTTISSPTGVSYLKDSVPWAWDTRGQKGN